MLLLRRAASRLTTLLVVGLVLVLAGCGPAVSGTSLSAVHGGPRTSTPHASSSATSSPTATSASPRAHPVVVGLGDSVTSGYGCDCQPFVERYAAQLPPSLGGPARAVNLGRGGSTSVDLLHDLRDDSETRRDVASADVVLVTIGANDLGPLLQRWIDSDCDNTCYDGAVRAVGSRISQILKQIHLLRGATSQQVLVTGYWNVFVGGEVGREEHGAAYLRWSSRLTRALNTQICHAATGAGARCVDLYAAFMGTSGDEDPTPLLASDGDHPDAAGHEVIARALIKATTPIAAGS